MFVEKDFASKNNGEKKNHVFCSQAQWGGLAEGSILPS